MNYTDTMKTRVPHLFAVFASAYLLLGAPARLHAQAIPPPPAPPLVDPATGLPIPPPRLEPVPFSDATEKKRAEAKFDGLPLTEVVKWLEETFPDVNFVLPGSLVEVRSE